MLFFEFGLLVDVLFFLLGCLWMTHLWKDLPKHLSEIRSNDPKVDRWPAMVVLAISAYMLLWMLRFVFRLLSLPFTA